MTIYEKATNLAFFLLEKTGTIYGCWKGRLSAAEQRQLFGEYRFGKRSIRVNGANSSRNS